MKQVTLITALLISASSFAQPTTGDTTPFISQNAIKAVKKDTAFVPLFEKIDTVKAHLLYVADNGAVMYTEGFAIVKGFVKQDKTWAAQPQIAGYLDSKKKPKTKVIQAF